MSDLTSDPVSDPASSGLTPAIALHRAGRLAEAEAIYRQILAAQPDHADALHLLGLIACQSNHLEAAGELIARALQQQPHNAEFLLNLGEVQRRQGRLHEAVATFRQAAAIAPGHAFTHYNLGVALAASGESAAAIAAYRQAIALQPAFPEALNNLGLLLHTAGENEPAVAFLRQALALRPAHPEAENNLGLALWNLQHHDAALQAFTRATQLRQDFAAAHANRAFALRKLGQREAAVAAFDRAAELHPDSAEIHRDRAMALLEVGQIDPALASARRAAELTPRNADTLHALGVVLAFAAKRDPQHRSPAIATYQQALQLRPDVPEWEFELADLQGRTPATAPDSYVKNLFDEYALRFEHHLVDELHYRVPHALLAAVQQRHQRPANERPAAHERPADMGEIPMPPLDILDLGCGTGLCGELFRPLACTITGIDLAPNMIARSQNRRDSAGKPFYDSLLTSHLLPALQQFDAAFDLLLAADVFIYVGALDQILPAAAHALRPGGLFAFSLERYDPPPNDTGPGFTLHHRFAHSLAYIRQLAAASGLTEVTAEPCHLRDDVPPGWLVILQK